MSRTRSPRVSSTTRSAIKASLLALACACASKVSPPVATIAAPPAAHVGIPVQLDGSQSVSLRPGQELSYAWSFLALPPRSAAKLNDPHLAQPSFTPDVTGTYSLKLVVDDGLLASSALVTMVVADDCRPVIVSVTQAPVAPDVGQTAGLSVTAASSCGTAAIIVAYQWSLVSAPPGSHAQLLLGSTAHPSFTPDVRGDYDLAVQVTDSLGLTSDLANPKAHLRYSTRACGDNVPVVDSVTSLPAAPDVGTLVQLSAAVHDSDSDPACGLVRALTYTWQLLEVPAGSQARLNDVHVKQPAFTPDLHGAYRAGLIVTDDLGRASQQGVTIVTTSGCGDSVPTAQAQGPAASVPAGTSVQLHTLVSDADNPDYDGLDKAGGPATTGAGCRLALSYQYRWQMVAAPVGSKAQLNNPSLANPTFLADVAGTYKASVSVTASTGRSSAPSLVTVTVDACGSVPVTVVINPVANGPTSKPVQLSATVTDTNDSCSTTPLVVRPYAYSWTLLQAPAGSRASLSGTTASGTSTAANPSFTPDKGGDYTFGLTVTDQLGLRAQAAAVTIHADDCNAALGLALLVNGQAGAAPAGITGAPTSLSVTITDPNDPAVNAACAAAVQPYSYQWSLVGEPAGSAAVLNDPAAAAPSFLADAAGTYTVQLVVTDAAGNRSPAVTQAVAVTSCTAPLVVSSISVALAPGTPLPTGAPVPLVAAVSDPNLNAVNAACPLVNALLTWQWQLVAQPSGSRAVLNNAAAANPSFLPDVGGTYTVQLVVTDAAGNRSPAKTKDIVVDGCNQPLGVVVSANGSSAAQNVAAGAQVALSAAVADPNDPAGNAKCTAAVQPYTYRWRLLSQPTGSTASLRDPASAQPGFVPDVSGAAASYSVVLTVTDAAGNSGTSQTLVLAAPSASACNQPLNLAPSSTPAASLKTRAAVTLSAGAVGNANPASCYAAGAAGLTYSWSLLSRPSGSATSLTDPTAAGPLFTPDLAGTYVFFVRVTDKLGNSGSATFTAPLVSACGAAPTVALGQSPAAPEVGQPVNLSAVVTDGNAGACGAPTAAPFTYAWTLTVPAGSSAVLSNARNASTSFVPDLAQAYAYFVTVTDAVGAQGTSATGTVTPVNCALAGLTITSTGGATTFSQVQLTANPAFPAGCATPPALAYAWSFDSLPSGSSAAFNSTSVKNPSFTLDRPNGTWIARVVVTDTLSGAQLSQTGSFSTNGCGSFAVVASVGTGGSAPGTSLVLGAVNHPTVPAGPDNGGGTLTAPVSVQLDGQKGLATPPPNQACGGVAYSYRWVLYQLPPGSTASIRPDTAALPTINLDKTGDYVFQLVVTDGIVTSAPTYFRLRAN